MCDDRVLLVGGFLACKQEMGTGVLGGVNPASECCDRYPRLQTCDE